MWPDPGDERRQSPGGDPGWYECFDLTFHSPRATFGGHITVVLWPARRMCWYWTSVVQEGAPLVTLLETDIELPRAGLELRAQGLWADHNCEIPFRHWSYGLEAFALRLDDPDEALGAFRGERIGLAYDLEWEAHDNDHADDAAGGGRGGGAGPVKCSDTRYDQNGYDQDGRVHGEVLIGADAFDLEGLGRRSHCWGVGTPWRPAGQTADTGEFAGWSTVGRTVARLPLADRPIAVERRLQRAADGGAWTFAVTPVEARSG